MEFNLCDQKTIFIEATLDTDGIRELFEFIYRAGYRGYIPDFERLSTPETEFLEILTNTFGIEFGSVSSNLMAFVGEITFHVIGSSGYPYNAYRLPLIPRAEA
jgi:hypothetical protein